MKILISFCNLPGNYGNNLLLIDLETGKTRYLLKNVSGFTGLTQDDEYFYALSQTSPTKIYIIEKFSGKVMLDQDLREVIDPHSLAVSGNFIYIVSTGNDQVLKYKFDRSKKRLFFQKIFWWPEDSDKISDTHHLNSISVFKDHIYISAFGPKKSEKWDSANGGYVFNITENKKEIENIYQPHSMFIKNNIFSKKNIYYCESSTKSIRKNNRTIIRLKKGGYTRGLYLEDKFLFLGTSGGRKKSKSTNLENNFADPGFSEEDCRLLVYKKNMFNKFTLTKSFDFLPNHKEIYDIIVLI